jgi:hypothetical protein
VFGSARSVTPMGGGSAPRSPQFHTLTAKQL